MEQYIAMMVMTVALLVVARPAEAAAQQLITLNVTLVAPACEINEGRPIQVDFGDNLQAPRIDGQNYMQRIRYQLSCPDSRTAGLTLTLSGEPAVFDSTVLTSSMADIGIRVLHNGMPMALNQPVSLDMHQLPQLHAVPVKRDGATLAKGRFSATATLRAGYF
ncbi:fimbrial protein [Erwinia sp. V71]|uniref:fimbrial protein n=1 Tax=Erwinia sp. V71 TaxID=3369424 RepID=UPI003F5E9BA1